MEPKEHEISHAHNGPRNIVICCDGTGNEFGDENSNVVKLYATLVINDEQLGYYHPGVGTMGSPNARGKIEKEFTRVMGLAFGSGLLANVGDAYRYLMDTYREGDNIYLFGFSRGAYTARALAGLLHVCGLLCPGNEGLIPYTIGIYATKSRKASGSAHTLDVAHRFKDTFSREVPIDFVGVWDTVSSVGWIYDPVILPDEGQNPIMKVGRQALSIDERRCFFRDKVWGDALHGQDIKQVWFAGVHSDVGGSYNEEQSGLSKLALEWMLREAYQFGLKIDLHRAAAVLGRSPLPEEPPYVPPDPAAQIHYSLTGAWWPLEVLPHEYYDKPDGRREWRIPLGARRNIPEGSRLHESVIQRLSLKSDYRPPNLPNKFSVEPRINFPEEAEERRMRTAAANSSLGVNPIHSVR